MTHGPIESHKTECEDHKNWSTISGFQMYDNQKLNSNQICNGIDLDQWCLWQCLDILYSLSALQPWFWIPTMCAFPCTLSHYIECQQAFPVKSQLRYCVKKSQNSYCILLSLLLSRNLIVKLQNTFWADII